MLAKEQYDMLGNLITTTTTPGSPTTTTTTLPPTTAATTETTTTPLPTVFPADSAAPLNVFERYTHLEAFLSRFSPVGLEVDRSTTAVYLPLSLLGLTFTAVVLFTWHTPQDASKVYTTSPAAPPLLPPSLWWRWRDRRRSDALLHLLGFFCCPLLLIHCSFCLLLDLDGVWRLHLLSGVIGVRAFCPLVHSLDITIRVTIALLVLLIAWRAYSISQTPRLRTTSYHCLNPYRRFWWCKVSCGLFSKAAAIIFVSFVTGLVGINFWQVTDITLPGTPEDVELICSPVGGYQSGFQFLSSDGTLLLYEWILNAVIFAPSALGAIVFALLLSRRLLANQSQAVLQTQAEVGGRVAFVYSRRVVHRLQLVNGLCALYGLANLPLVATRLLAVMTTPGVAELPDREILVDPTWQRMFHHTTAIIICREFADMATTGLIFPTFTVISSAFRHRFLRLLRLEGPDSSCCKTAHSFSQCLLGGAGRTQGQPPQPSLSAARAHSPPVRWSWGKGWRQSYSLPLSPPVVETALALGEKGTAEEADPDQLDAEIEQHNNAYMASRIDRSGAPHHYVKHRTPFTPSATSKRWTANGRRTCYL